MEISAQKTKLMTNNTSGLTEDISISGEVLEPVQSFKYLGAIISDKGSKPELLSRSALTIVAMTKLKPIWSDKNITVKSKIKLMRSLAISIYLYACESWTLTTELEKRIKALEMRCYRKILGITYKDHITNEEVRNKIENAIGPHDDLLTIVKRRKLKWYGHVTRSSGMAKTFLQGTVEGTRRRGRPRKVWEDNIPEWTGLEMKEAVRRAEHRDDWRKLVSECVMPQRSAD